MTRPLYGKVFTRDFTLCLVEIWARAESTNPKRWTTKKQPFLPFMVHERTRAGVSCYMDERGVKWMKDELASLLKADPSFMGKVEHEFETAYIPLRDAYFTKENLDSDELRRMLVELEEVWSWFEAGWWIWESSDEERGGIPLSKNLERIRVETQDISPRSDELIRASLENIFPHSREYVAVISGDEVRSGALPSADVLEKRMGSYFLVAGKLYVGARREEIEQEYGISLEHYDTEGASQASGQSACAGAVKGPVRLVYSVSEIAKVREGDVLISPMTLPDYMPAIQKAGAIVTDEGGIMCHAAIVARELKKPCVIGTKVATQIFKDGDMVEVDAEKGIVRKL